MMVVLLFERAKILLKKVATKNTIKNRIFKKAWELEFAYYFLINFTYAKCEAVYFYLVFLNFTNYSMRKHVN